ncbi:MAG: branched-chain amino acid ABC transporter permease [Nocardiopsaceae bacterium]|nr:branched-chain amino acid ABC transporter permease [Nocardiopsaceae bacterium]
MTLFLQTVVSGLLIGCIYGLIGIGFSISYLTSGILNFAQGDLVGIGAYLMLEFYLLGLPLVAALILAAVAVGIVIALANLAIFQPLYRYGMVFPTLCTFGVSIIIQSAIQLLWGAQPRVLRPMLTASTFAAGDVRVSPAQILGAGVSIILCLAIVWMLARTRTGQGMRALARDPDVAAFVGIRPRRLLFGAYAIAGVLAVVAAAMIAPAQGLSPQMGTTLTVLGFTAAALGGFGSPAGALIGGLAVGASENIVAVYVNPSYKDAITYGLLILVLLLRPRGLLGEKQAQARTV